MSKVTLIEVENVANEVCAAAYTKVKGQRLHGDLAMIGAAAQIVMKNLWLDSTKVLVLDRVIEKITRDGWE